MILIAVLGPQEVLKRKYNLMKLHMNHSIETDPLIQIELCFKATFKNWGIFKHFRDLISFFFSFLLLMFGDFYRQFRTLQLSWENTEGILDARMGSLELT